jgi:hypothetical protein
MAQWDLLSPHGSGVMRVGFVEQLLPDFSPSAGYWFPRVAVLLSSVFSGAVPA